MHITKIVMNYEFISYREDNNNDYNRYSSVLVLKITKGVSDRCRTVDSALCHTADDSCSSDYVCVDINKLQEDSR